MALDIGVLGVKELIKEFNSYDDKFQRAVFKKACKNAMEKLVLPRAIANAPVDEGTLKGELTTRAAKRRGETGTSVIATGDAYYGLLVDTGHSMPNGTVIPPTNFLRKAFDDVREALVPEVAKELQAEMDKKAKQAGTL